MQRSDLLRLWQDTRVRTPVEIVGFLGTLAGLYTWLGKLGFSVGTACIVAYYIYQVYKYLKRMNRIHTTLRAELPNHHAFLVEFLRETYNLPRDELLSKTNSGLLIHEYKNDFKVDHTDCANSQAISGQNVGSAHSRGIAFALVGGSSVDSGDLNAKYKAGRQEFRDPEFLVDNDRFKIVLCGFPQPLPPYETFAVQYEDSWPGSMRRGADGFFFPEPLFFPAGIQHFSTRVEFSFSVQSIAVLSVNIEEGTVRMCDVQPRAIRRRNSANPTYQWEYYSPPSNTIHVMYYATEQ